MVKVTHEGQMIKFSDTAVSDSHSDTAIFQLRAHWVQMSWSIGAENPGL